MSMNNVNITWSCGWSPPKLPEKTGDLFAIENLQSEFHATYLGEWIREYCSSNLKGEKQMRYNLEKFYRALSDPRRTEPPKLVVTNRNLYPFPIEVPVHLELIDYESMPYISPGGELRFRGVCLDGATDSALYTVKNGHSITKSPNNSVHVDRSFQIKKVIFNEPATIVFWQDGTKTVVKTQNEEDFDPEKGLAMAIAKKAMGNEGNYFNQIKKWTEEYHDERLAFCFEAFNASLDAVKEALGLKKNPEPVKCDVMSEEKETLQTCENCLHVDVDIDVEPCRTCHHGNSNWEPKA